MVLCLQKYAQQLVTILFLKKIPHSRVQQYIEAPHPLSLSLLVN
jgi:hypothetical protein